MRKKAMMAAASAGQLAAKAARDGASAGPIGDPDPPDLVSVPIEGFAVEVILRGPRASLERAKDEIRKEFDLSRYCCSVLMHEGADGVLVGYYAGSKQGHFDDDVRYMILQRAASKMPVGWKLFCEVPPKSWRICKEVE
jgi:hypothetical protein